MAKSKRQQKNTRAARRGLVEEEDFDLPAAEKKDGRTMVLEKLAEIGVRQPEAPATKSKIAKNKKGKSKTELRKREKAEMIKDMLQEKIDTSKSRHKLIKTLRKAPEEKETADRS